jgi:hypothetical protein
MEPPDEESRRGRDQDCPDFDAGVNGRGGDAARADALESTMTAGQDARFHKEDRP